MDLGYLCFVCNITRSRSDPLRPFCLAERLIYTMEPSTVSRTSYDILLVVGGRISKGHTKRGTRLSGKTISNSWHKGRSSSTSSGPKRYKDIHQHLGIVCVSVVFSARRREEEGGQMWFQLVRKLIKNECSAYNISRGGKQWTGERVISEAFSAVQQKERGKQKYYKRKEIPVWWHKIGGLLLAPCVVRVWFSFLTSWHLRHISTAEALDDRWIDL